MSIFTLFKKSLLLIIAGLILIACGGGGGDSNPSGSQTNTTTSNNTNNTSTINTTSLELELGEAQRWTFAWNSKTETFAQPNTSTSNTQYGIFTVTLGAAENINGQTAYPISISGDTGEFEPRWTHVAIDTDGSLLGSTNGINFETIYNANTDLWVGGGFFIQFGSSESVEINPGIFEGEYNTVNALVAGHSSSDGGCETILGITICSDTSTDFSEYEYYKEGLGPVGYQLDISYTSEGGGFFTSTSIEKTIELIDTTFIASDETVFSPPPWEEVASLNTARSDHSAVVLNNQIYVVGGYSGDNFLASVEIYNVDENEWVYGANMPGATSGEAAVIGGRIYIEGAIDGDVYIFDPIVGWSVTRPLPDGAGTFGSDVDTFNDVTFGDIIVGITGATIISNSLGVEAYQPSGNLWLTGTPLLINEWLRSSLSIIGDTMYIIGGFGRLSSFDDHEAQAGVITYNLATDVWSTTAVSDMGVARDNHSSVVMDGNIYVLGGNPVSCGQSLDNCNIGAALRSVEFYNPETNAWSDIPSMFAARKDFDVVVYNEKLYAIGGSAGGERLANVERYSPQ